MIALTLGAVLVTVFRPIAWSAEETRLAIVGPAAIGILVFLVAVPLGVAVKPIGAGPAALTPTVISLLLILGSGVVWAILRFAGIWGLGPLAPSPDPDDPVRLTEPGSPPPEGWLRPGTLLGLPIVWGVIWLAVVPIVVYVISYLPWVALGNRLTDTWPPGHTGQTLLDLTRQMYDYHNGLRATHAASSPYWAWPFDLKPVWFYQDSFAANTAAAIYDAGNLVAWWLSIPAMLFVAWQAFKRRSLALGLVVRRVRVPVAAVGPDRPGDLPVPLLRGRAVPADRPCLLRGRAAATDRRARTWALARVSAAIAVLGPALMWLFKGPLCTFVRVTAVNPGSEACVATAPGQIVLTWRTAGLAAVLLVAGGLLVFQILRLGSGARSAEEANRRFLQIAATAVGGVIGLVLVGGLLPDSAILSQDGFRIEPIALVVLVALSPIAWVVATARDSRRFAAGILLACVVWFVTWYPNISGLPVAGRDRERVPGPPADLPVRVPVPGQHGQGRPVLDHGPPCRHAPAPGRAPRHERDRGLRGMGLADRRGRARSGAPRPRLDRDDRSGRLRRVAPASVASGRARIGQCPGPSRERQPRRAMTEGSSAAPRGSEIAGWARGEAGISARKSAGRAPWAASRRITKP